MNRKYMLAAGAAVALALSLPFVSLAQEKAKPKADRSETYQQLNLFGDVLERIRSDYVDEANDKDLIENAINGMLTALDPHSSYMNSKAYNDMKVDTKGEFGGLGIEVTMEGGWVKVVSPIDDTPAQRAGLQPGDLIVALDGDSVQGLTLQEAVEKMRGKIGSAIKLTIKRGTKDPFDVSLVRAVIKIRTVRSSLEGDVGYVRVTQFNEQADRAMRQAIEDIKKQAGNKLKGLVLDLRNNPGGLLDQAIAVSDTFLEKGEIVSTRSRRPDDGQRFNAKPGDIINGLPLVVLINGGSASASEIVAGALQDHHRAILLGTRSFGKGSVQTIMPVAGGGAIRLTTALYYTPSGRSIQKKGIDPDLVVEQAKIEPVAKDGVSRREENLRGAINNPAGQKDRPDDKGAVKPGDDKGAAKPADPKAEPKNGEENRTGPNPETDYQLARALDLIRGIALYNTRGN